MDVMPDNWGVITLKSGNCIFVSGDTLNKVWGDLAGPWLEVIDLAGAIHKIRTFDITLLSTASKAIRNVNSQFDNLLEEEF